MKVAELAAHPVQLRQRPAGRSQIIARYLPRIGLCERATSIAFPFYKVRNEIFTRLFRARPSIALLNAFALGGIDSLDARKTARNDFLGFDHRGIHTPLPSSK
jgi:hypothetical protein